MTIQTLDILPNGATVIDFAEDISKVLAFNEGAVSPWVIWSINPDTADCYSGVYHRTLAEAVTSSYWSD